MLLACLISGGCIINQPVPKQYTAYRIGVVSYNSNQGSTIWVVTIEGHTYYCSLGGNGMIVGPEVPADALKKINKRLWRAEEEEITLD
jgi:hypothetical protein